MYQLISLPMDGYALGAWVMWSCPGEVGVVVAVFADAADACERRVGVSVWL